MLASEKFEPRISEHFGKMFGFLNPGDDPAYLIIKTHLMAEEMLYAYIVKQARYPKVLERARLSFKQLLVLCQALHHIEPADWWGWTALEKLNSIRNVFAHNLDSLAAKKKIVDFSLFVAEAIGATKPTEIGEEYGKIARAGTHPLILGLVALHAVLLVALEFHEPQDYSKIFKQ